MFKEDPASDLSSLYQYLRHYQVLITTTLETLGEETRETFDFGYKLHFSSTSDIQAQCDPLLEYFRLGDAKCMSVQELNFGQTGTLRKMLVLLVIVLLPPRDYTSVSNRLLTAIAEHPHDSPSRLRLYCYCHLSSVSRFLVASASSNK
ncbi:hypothetical protein D9757_012509 [Collybiopsis confluens]|uniref:Uncharacterized protein n=1 Tax=Collybiopsis confluens TaxID=2823264 RepID=A0A8H5D227_9AGAR|nr:hypothetical protein D9757_012509 [Collybiopsis confluens]